MNPQKLSAHDLAMFEKGMDAVFLVIDDVEKTSRTVPLFPSRIVEVFIDRVKKSSKLLLQEMTCMTHDLDPDHVARLARAAQGEGIRPGEWKSK